MRWLTILFFASVLRGQTSADSIALASLAREDSSLYVITPLRINGIYPDYCPFVNQGELFFVSARPANMGVVYADKDNKTEIANLYRAPLKTPAKPGTPKRFEVSSRFHEGPFCFNASGDTLYFTGNDGRSPQLRIMSSIRTGDKWSKPEPLDFCRDSFAYCHPSLAGSSKLYLSSNQETGGDMDLFVSELNDGKWSEPTNLGPKINSEKNEVFPFAARHGHLYFSSNRPGGLGGLDLYHVLTGTDDKPLLLHPPMNSAADDFGLFTDSSGNTGYISSGRESRRSDDIFYFDRSMPDFSRSGEPPVRTRFCYTFYEATTAAVNDTNILYYQWRFGDGHTGRGLNTRHCYTAPGTYKVELSVVEKLSGQIDTSLVSYDIQIPEQEKLRIAVQDTADTGQLVVLDATASAVKDHEITGLYWSFGDGYYNRGGIVGHRYRNPGKFLVELWVTARNRQSGAEAKFKTTLPVTIRGTDQ